MPTASAGDPAWSLRVVGPRDVQPTHLVLQCRTFQGKAFSRSIGAGNPA